MQVKLRSLWPLSLALVLSSRGGGCDRTPDDDDDAGEMEIKLRRMLDFVRSQRQATAGAYDVITPLVPPTPVRRPPLEPPAVPNGWEILAAETED